MPADRIDGDVVGIDLGGTKIFGARLNVDGDAVTVAATRKEQTPQSGPADVADAVAEVVRALSDRPGVVGVGAPGVVDTAAGTVLTAPNLAGFEDPVRLRDLLGDRLGVAVTVGNDVNVAALAEARVGAARGMSNVLAAWMGTGLGGGLVLDGRLRTGPNGLAGELGHVVVVPGGRRCPCGGSGHLEAYIGRRAMEDQARALAAEGRGSELVDLAGPGRMKSSIFRRAYDSGDAVAVELLELGMSLLGVAVANVVVVVDLDAVVVGGGLGERFADVAVDWVSKSLADHDIIVDPPTVVAAMLGDEAGAVGAGLLALDMTAVRS